MGSVEARAVMATGCVDAEEGSTEFMIFEV